MIDGIRFADQSKPDSADWPGLVDQSDDPGDSATRAVSCTGSPSTAEVWGSGDRAHAALLDALVAAEGGCDDARISPELPGPPARHRDADIGDESTASDTSDGSDGSGRVMTDGSDGSGRVMTDGSDGSGRVMTDGSGFTDGRAATLASAIRHHAKMGRRRARVEYNRLAVRLPQSGRAIDGDRAIREMGDATNVLVLCAGNICRSPMAERYLRERLNERDIDDVTVESAGFVRKPDRPSPDLAVQAATEFDVDLSSHGSSVLTADQLSRSDVVFLMDAYNYDAMKRRFPHALDKTFFLKPVGPDDGFEIVDPHGSDVETFYRVYGEISDAIDRAVDEIGVDRP